MVGPHDLPMLLQYAHVYEHNEYSDSHMESYSAILDLDIQWNLSITTTYWDTWPLAT